MQKVLLGISKEDADKDLQIKLTINKYLIIRDWTETELIKRSGMSRGSYYNAKRSPSLFRIEQLRSIYNALRVPEEERRCV